MNDIFNIGKIQKLFKIKDFKTNNVYVIFDEKYLIFSSFGLFSGFGRSEIINQLSSSLTSV